MVCSIDLSSAPRSSKFILELKLFHNNGYWKSDWNFEGITLTPDPSEGAFFQDIKKKYMIDVEEKPFTAFKQPKPRTEKGN